MVQPSPVDLQTLVAKGYEEKLAGVALQLSNGSESGAEAVLSKLAKRASSFEAIAAKASVAASLSAPSGQTSQKGSASLDDPTAICNICGDSDPLKRDQLVCCSACTKFQHTICFGGRKIPFGLRTLRDKQNRDKYMSKAFSGWRCGDCTNQADKENVSNTNLDLTEANASTMASASIAIVTEVPQPLDLSSFVLTQQSGAPASFKALSTRPVGSNCIGTTITSTTTRSQLPTTSEPDSYIEVTHKPSSADEPVPSQLALPASTSTETAASSLESNTEGEDAPTEPAPTAAVTESLVKYQRMIRVSCLPTVTKYHIYMHVV